MHSLQMKALKVIKKLQVEHDNNGAVPDYQNISQDPENTLSLSVFLGDYDWYRGYIGYKTFGDAGGTVCIHNPKNLNELKHISNSPIFIASKILSKNAFEAISSLAKENNALLVYDLDDNLHELSPFNKAKSYFNKENLLNVENIISKCDHVIFSTRELLAYYKHLNKNSSYYPNFIDFDRYPNTKFNWRDLAIQQECLYDENTIIVGFFGSDSHIEDLVVLKDAICNIIDNNNVLLAIVSSSDLAFHVLIKEWGLPSNRFLFIPFKNIKKL